MKQENFILFARARTGSTSLAKLLNDINNIKVAIEPFHPKYIQWNPEERNYSEYIVDLETMDTAIAELFDKYAGLKVLMYQFDRNIYQHLLTKANVKILFLTRRKLIHSTLSNLIAEQTSFWQKEDVQDNSKYSDLQPIPIDKIKQHFESIREMSDFLS